MANYLVAMIDGETVGFAIAQDISLPTLDKLWTGQTKDYPTFIDALQHYLKRHDLRPSDYEFALAVAGVAGGDIIRLTNCRWFISVSGLRAFLRSEPLVLNTCAATAWSFTMIDSSRLISVDSYQPRPIVPGSTFLCVGTGIGLGMATLHVTRGGQVAVLESEGGHSSFAPQNATDDALLAFLRKQFGHVSYERILSKPGLQNIYRFLSARDSRQSSPSEASDIIAAARQRVDPLAVETIAIFSSILGSFIGSAVLTVTAWDGVFLAGDLLREIAPTLKQSDFRKSLEAKGRLGKMIERLPVCYPNIAETRLIGAAAALAAKASDVETVGCALKAVA